MTLFVFIVAGNLVVNVLAKTRDFVRGMGAARSQLKGFRSQVSQFRRFASGAAGLLGVGFSARQFTGFLSQQAQALDALGKTATRLGIATEELQFYQFAAKQAGVATNTLNMAIQRMTRRIGEFAKGGGEAKDTLEELGFDAEQLARLKPEEQFKLMLEQLRGIGDENERLRVAFKLFDSEGVAVLQMAENLGQVRREFNSMNIAVREFDVRKIEELTDQLGKTGEVFAAAGRDFLIELGPEIDAYLTAAEALVQDARRNRMTSDQRRRADFLGIDEGDERLTTLARIGERLGPGAGAALFSAATLGATGATGFSAAGSPLERSLQRSEQLEIRRQAAIAANPGQIAAGANTTSELYLAEIAANTRPAQTKRDGT